NIRNEAGDEVAGSGDYPNYSTITELACLEDGCYTFELFDSFGDGWNDGTFELILNGTILASGTLEDGEFGSVPFGVNAEGCEEVVLGCTDPEAINYNPDATEDDGSCEYFECETNEVTVVIFTENWGYEISWNIRNEEGDEVAGSGVYPNYSTITEWTCLEDGCYTFELFDTFGDGWNGGSFQVILNNNILASGTLADGEFGAVAFGVNTEGCEEEEEVFGCTDPLAINFNPDATIEDGSCQYSCSNVTVGFDFTAGSPNSSNYMDWTLYGESLQAPIDTGVFNSWADFVGFCLEDGCYTFVIGNIPSEWEGIYNVISDNEFVAFGEFNGETSSIEFTFGVNSDDCGGIEPVFGCTDPLAMNFNPDATIDNGSCQYNCSELTLGFDFFNGAPDDSTFYAFHWVIVNELDNVVEFGEYSYGAPQENLCLDDGCYTFSIFLISPDWNGIYNLFMANEVLAQGEFSGESESFEFTFGVNAEGCDGTNEVFGCTDPIAINYNPDATIDDGSCEYDFECGISFEVSADSTGGNMFYIIPSDNIVNASSVLWDFGDGSTSAEFYPTHVYESDGPFTLCLFVTFEDDNGNFCEISYCEILDGSIFGSGFLSGGFMINVIQPGALSDNLSLAQKELSVYPNPTNDITTISFVSDQSDKLTLRVTDLTGKVIEEKILSSSVGQQKIQVDLSEFPQGLYLIGLEQSGSRSYAKVVRR
ncbi:MAG: T9SS type A sorting domain-containing protein, partial [Cryomorphaceae bacterium]